MKIHYQALIKESSVNYFVFIAWCAALAAKAI